jgi:inhibitor of cysteine peptidase
MVSLTSEDAGRPISVNAGEAIEIGLPENPTTGFRWSIESLSGELTLVSSEFEPAAQPKPGAGGRRAIRLRANDPGAGELQLRYSREWQSASANARTAIFTFAIKSA